jgi:hypothetical protein
VFLNTHVFLFIATDETQKNAQPTESARVTATGIDPQAREAVEQIVLKIIDEWTRRDYRKEAIAVVPPSILSSSSSSSLLLPSPQLIYHVFQDTWVGNGTKKERGKGNKKNNG